MDELYSKFAIVSKRSEFCWYWYVSFRLFPGDARYKAEGIERTEEEAHRKVMCNGSKDEARTE